MVIKYKKGTISKKQVCEYLKKRDLMAGLLEMDSAPSYRHYMDILADENTEGKFICLIRDCYSWLDALHQLYHGTRTCSYTEQRDWYRISMTICPEVRFGKGGIGQ